MWAKILTKNRSRARRLTAAVLVAAILLTAAPACAAQRQFIGDEPADQNNLTGDVVAERQMEYFLLPLNPNSVAVAGGLTGEALIVGSGPAGILAGPLLLTLSALGNYKGLPWQNWPMGRYLFWHYPPDKFLGILPQMSGITLWVLDTIANSVFSVTKFLVVLGINLMYFAFDTQWLTGIADWIGAAARDIFTFNGKSFADVALKISLILLFIMAMQRLLAGHLASTVQSLIVAVVAFTAVLFYTVSAPQVIRSMVSLTDGVAGVALSASSHFFWQSQNSDQFKSDLDRGLANAGTAVWQTCVAAPWAAAQFGTADAAKLQVTNEEWAVLDKSAFPQDKRQALEQKVLNGTLYADTLFLACGDDKSRDAVAEMLGQFKKPTDHGRHSGSIVGFAPSTGNVLYHMGTAAMTILPALMFVVLVLVIGGMIILSQLVLVLLLIFAPAALLAAMVPDAGWAIATRYFKTMLAFLVNKLIFGIYLGGLLAIATGIVRGILG
ncbi:MAG: hypothetical protein ACPLSY_03240 [Moorellaceae bacterium]